MKNQGRYFENIFNGDYQLKLFDLADGILRTEDGRSFQIHKFTLARSSKYFQALFSGTGKEKNDFMVPGVKGEDLSNILSFLYTGNIHVTEENILDLIVASNYLLLDDLLLRLKQHLRKNLNPANSLSILKTSLEIKQSDISRETYRYIQTHFEDICCDSQLSELPLDSLKQLLSDRNLRVTSEMVVWGSVIKWVEADTVNRLCSVPDLLLHLAILDVDDNMADSILQHEIVAKNPHCKEILDVKQCTSNGGLKNLQCYFQACSRPVMSLSDHRQPRQLHLIGRPERISDKGGIAIYVTYDENFDLWRKITEVDTSSDFVLCFNNCIYLFDTYGHQNIFYDVIEKQWNQLANFRTQRDVFEVVELDGRIYALGVRDGPDDTELFDGEYYNFETGDWHTTESMIPVDGFKAIALRNFIYVLGYQGSHGDLQMIFQAYDPSSDTWSRLPSPTTNRDFIEMVVYRDMIYVIGGRNDETALESVEVFDASTNTWNTEAALPYRYYRIKSIMVNDKLIIYDEDHQESPPPPVQWDFYQNRWELFEDFSMKSFCKYNFIKVENECFSIFSRENKDPGTHFEYSPFA